MQLSFSFANPQNPQMFLWPDKLTPFFHAQNNRTPRPIFYPSDREGPPYHHLLQVHNPIISIVLKDRFYTIAMVKLGSRLTQTSLIEVPMTSPPSAIQFASPIPFACEVSH